MITLLPLHDEQELLRLNRLEGVNARLAYCLRDGGETTGWILYDPVPGEAVIHAVHAPDADSFDGLVRAAFAGLLDLSINRARFADGVDKTLLEKLGFAAPGESATPSIENLLYNCKHCQRGEAGRKSVLEKGKTTK